MLYPDSTSFIALNSSSLLYFDIKTALLSVGGVQLLGCSSVQIPGILNLENFD
jgi:hypothetical protein